MKVLVPHGTTPTGFGVGMDDQSVFLLTACCGVKFSEHSVDLLCSACSHNYSSHPVTHQWDLSYHGSLVGSSTMWDSIVHPWLVACLGVDAEDLKIEVSE